MPDLLDSNLEAFRSVLSHRPPKANNDESLSPASVFILIYHKDGGYCILLNKRSQQVEHHKGEMSFPGGARDPEDATFLDAALRECQEEMGIDPRDITTLGQLDDVVTRSRFCVKVFVGTIPYPYAFVPSSVEIEEVLEAPISGLLDPANLREEVRWSDGKARSSNCYAFGDHLIYGATAQMVDRLLELVPMGLRE
jgi:8-oxo-dGTP pyrophosphatase MutT (NUDIX family)